MFAYLWGLLAKTRTLEFISLLLTTDYMNDIMHVCVQQQIVAIDVTVWNNRLFTVNFKLLL